MDLISIVVPVYNVEAYLEKCVVSLVKQSYKEIEILLIDDGSTDNSSMLCDSLAKKYKNVVSYHKENGGLSDARNCGIRHARGKYIGFVDSDDYVEERMYEVLLNNMCRAQADISICAMFVENTDGTSSLKTKREAIEIYTNSKDAIIALNSYKGFDMSACTKLYKRCLFEHIEFPFGKKCEDYYTMYRLFDVAHTVVYQPIPLYHYVQRGNSISRNSVPDDAYIDGSKAQLEFISQKYPDILPVGISAYVFANIAKVNKAIEWGNSFASVNARNNQLEVRTNLKWVLFNKYLPLKKKIQAIIFSLSLSTYSYIYSKL